MNNTTIGIAVLVVLVLVAVAWYYMSADPAAPAAPTAPATTYTAATPASVWAADAANAYKCPTGYTTKSTSGYCVLDQADAEAACTADKLCTGYFIPGDKSTHWHSDVLAKKWAQLTGKAPQSTAGWDGTVFYAKNA